MLGVFGSWRSCLVLSVFGALRVWCLAYLGLGVFGVRLFGAWRSCLVLGVVDWCFRVGRLACLLFGVFGAWRFWCLAFLVLGVVV
jgi:hypothetical protein